MHGVASSTCRPPAAMSRAASSRASPAGTTRSGNDLAAGAAIRPDGAVGIHEHVGDRARRAPGDSSTPNTAGSNAADRRRRGASSRPAAASCPAARATNPVTPRGCTRRRPCASTGADRRGEGSAKRAEEKERGGAYWGEQAPPQQRWIGGNRGRCTPRLRSDGTECTPKGGPCNRRNSGVVAQEFCGSNRGLNAVLRTASQTPCATPATGPRERRLGSDETTTHERDHPGSVADRHEDDDVHDID